MREPCGKSGIYFGNLRYEVRIVYAFLRDINVAFQNLMEDATFFQQIQQARMINHMESVFFSRGFTRLAAIVLKRITNCCGNCKNISIFKNVRFSRRGEQAVVGNPEYIVKPTSGSVPKRLKRKIEDRIREYVISILYVTIITWETGVKVRMH